MSPRRSSRRRSSPWPGEESVGEEQKGETATARGRFPLPAIVACLALLPIVAAGCGGGGEDDAASTSSAAARQSVSVNIKSFEFSPAAVKVRKGGTLTFTNKDKAPHTAQTELNPKAVEFDTKRLELGDEGEVTLDKPGKFEYFCVYHRFMEGTVEVVE